MTVSWKQLKCFCTQMPRQWRSRQVITVLDRDISTTLLLQGYNRTDTVHMSMAEGCSVWGRGYWHRWHGVKWPQRHFWQHSSWDRLQQRRHRADGLWTLCHLSRSLFTSTGPSHSPTWLRSPRWGWPSCPTSSLAVWPATLPQRSWGAQGRLENKTTQQHFNDLCRAVSILCVCVWRLSHLTADILIPEVHLEELLTWLWYWACWLTSFDLLGYLKSKEPRLMLLVSAVPSPLWRVKCVMSRRRDESLRADLP